MVCHRDTNQLKDTYSAMNWLRSVVALLPKDGEGMKLVILIGIKPESCTSTRGKYTCFCNRSSVADLIL